jgi:hypothetical protein
MKLQLADNGKVKLIKKTVNGQTAVYNPNTGEGMVIQSEGMGSIFSGIFGTKATRTAKRNQRDTRRINRYESKTERQDERHTRKNTRLDKRTARQHKGLVRVKGKEKIIQAKQEGKIDQITAKQQGSKSEDFNKESDNIPDTSNVNGGDWQTTDQSKQQDQEALTTVQPKIIPKEDAIIIPNQDAVNVPSYELIINPDYDTNEDQNDEGYEYQDTDIDNDFESEPVPLNGWIDLVVAGGKKLLTKAQDSKAGQTVSSVAQQQADYKRMQQENIMLTAQVQSLKNQLLIYGGGGIVLGALSGVVISKVISK